MKYINVTPDSLVALGYSAKHVINATWPAKAAEIKCTPKQQSEIFDIVARSIRSGNRIEISRNNIMGTVSIYVDALDFTGTMLNEVFFLSRPMSETECGESSDTDNERSWKYRAI